MNNYLLANITCIIIFIIWIIKKFYQQANLPHGPIPLPIVGNYFLLKHDTYTNLDNLASTYGSIFTLWFGNKPIIMVSDYYIALDVCQKNGMKFSARPDIFNKELTRNRQRLAFMNFGPKYMHNWNIWKRASKVNSEYLEKCVAAVTADLCNIFSLQKEIDFNPLVSLKNSVMEVMSQIVYGTSSNVKYSDLNLSGHHNLLTLANATHVFQWMRYLGKTRSREYRMFLSKRETILKELFEKSRINSVDSAISTTILNAFGKDEDQIRQAEILCSDVYLFGIESLIAALEWALLYVSNWPEIQRMLQKELDRESNNSKYISVKDAMSMPYLQAAILETIRLSSLNPLSPIYESTKDVTLRGYKLPKGISLCLNLNAIHHSSKYWENPYEFSPCRFVKFENGMTTLKKMEEMKGFLAFGSGIRACMGDQLAMEILSTILANLLFKFRFDMSPWSMKPALAGTTWLILTPKSYSIRIEER